MTTVAQQIKSIPSGDFSSNIGIVRQIGQAFLRNGYEIAGITIDTVTEEDHESTVTATSHPIEFGANVTDHIYANADAITVSGIISDLAVGDFFDVGLLGVASKIKGLAGGDLITKSSQSWAKLKEVQRSGELISIVTNLMEYKNMAIISMSTKQNKDTADEVRFTMSLREIFIVGTQKYSGDVAGLIGETASKAKPETSLGANNARTNDAVAPTQNNGAQIGNEINEKNENSSLGFKAYSKIRDSFR